MTISNAGVSDIHAALGKSAAIVGVNVERIVPQVCVDPVNLDTGEGGIAISTTDPAIFAQAYKQACAETTEPKERTLRTYRIAAKLAASKKETPMPAPAPRTASVKQPQPGVANKRNPKPSQQAPAPSAADRLYRLERMLLRTQDMLQQLLPAPTEEKVPEERAPVVCQEYTELPSTSTPDATMMPQSKAVAFVEDSFDKLGIPGLGPVAKKPEFRVEFDLGDLGRMQARYHWVGVHAGCIFLVYDTRFEYGMLFEPPVLGSDRPIIVRTKADTGPNEFKVVSLDLVHPFGIFYIINLPIVEETPLPRPQALENNPALMRMPEALYSKPENDHGF